MVTIKTQEEIIKLKDGGKILAIILNEVIKNVKKGVSTEYLEELAKKRIKEAGAEPSFLNYKNKAEDVSFPTCLCASINSAIVHGPACPKQILRSGDVIGLDLGIKYKGLFTDMARTVIVGKADQKAKKLIKVAKKSLEIAQKQVKPGNHISDVSRAVQVYAEKEGFGVVKSLVGHGVGYAVHEPPRIPNYVEKNQPIIELKEGMVLAIEPMLTVGDPELITADDGWTQITKDGSLTAHFENTVVVTNNGYEVITKK